jgi:hypothetical protein
MTTTTIPARALTAKQRDSFDPSYSKHLLATVAANVENSKLTDAEFRDFIRNSLPVAFAGNCGGVTVEQSYSSFPHRMARAGAEY